MSRRHPTPVLIDPANGILPLRPLGLGADEERRVSEATIRDLIIQHPSCLPIRDIDPLFDGALAVCTELNTPAGPIDAFLITPSGLPVLVECKLWRNPESRREVVGQIIDYAKELSRWTCSDLQREISRRLNADSDALLRLVRERAPSTDEIEFNDAVTLNLRRGRFLLLIVGDGIREGVEAIAEYVQRHAGLHFTLGLIELPLFEAPGGCILIAPRVVARTQLITRTVVAAPEGHLVESTDALHSDADIAGVHPTTADRISFWSDFLNGLSLDDREQPRPKPADQGYLSFMLPAPGGSSWLTVYRNVAKGEVGVFLSYSRASVGERATLRVLEDVDEYLGQIGGDPKLDVAKDGRRLLTVRKQVGALTDPTNRQLSLAWLRERTNEYVNVFRPRIRAAVADLAQDIE